MLGSGQWRALAALATVPLALAACGSQLPTLPSAPVIPEATVAPTAPIPVSPISSQSAEPSSAPAGRLDATRLVEGVTRADLARHLAALQAVAESHGGDRATGSKGFHAASAYAAGVVEAAGYRVERRSFEIDGVTGTNLLVERRGATDDVVMLGAHLDTVAGSPGMNDNASGVAAVLAIAETLSALPAPHHTVRLALWDAEEGGAFGSRAYVASLGSGELARIRAYLNLDMIGSPNPLRLVYDEADDAAGSNAISARFGAILDDAGLTWEPIDLEGDSDHGPFIAAGIPTGGLFSGGIEPVTDAQAERFGAAAGVPADACSHRPCDTLANVEATGAAELARIAAAVLVSLSEGGAD